LIPIQDYRYEAHEPKETTRHDNGKLTPTQYPEKTDDMTLTEGEADSRDTDYRPSHSVDESWSAKRRDGGNPSRSVVMPTEYCKERGCLGMAPDTVRFQTDAERRDTHFEFKIKPKRVEDIKNEVGKPKPSVATFIVAAVTRRDVTLKNQAKRNL
jgi:hypothetical protein